MKKILILASLFVFLAQPLFVFAQEESVSQAQSINQETEAEREESVEASGDSTEAEEDKNEESEKAKKHYLAALGTIIVPSIFIGSYNRFVSRAPWAQVTWDDASHFYEHELKWDTDWYWTNFVLHPYQGSLTYMGARALNLNLAESAVLTTASSFVWEYFFETNSPSKNDLIYTSLGGVVVGEMFYRLSKEADDWNKLVSYALNPTRFYTNLFEKNYPGTTGNIQELSFRFSMGASHAYTMYAEDASGERTSRHETFPIYLGPELSVVYADPYGHDTNSPYSQFELDFGAEIGKGSGEGADKGEQMIMYRVQIRSNGVLWSRAPEFSKRDTTIGFVLDYDFLWHSFAEISSLAPAFAIKQRINKKESHIDYQLHLGWNLLGTADNYYYRRAVVDAEEYRDYSYNMGPEFVAKWRWASDAGHTFDLDLHAYGFYDFYDQLQEIDSTGYEAAEFLTVRYEHPVSENVRLGLDNEFYFRQSFFDKYYDDVYSFMYSGKIYARIMLIK
jgi:hypothetical protein